MTLPRFLTVQQAANLLGGDIWIAELFEAGEELGSKGFGHAASTRFETSKLRAYLVKHHGQDLLEVGTHATPAPGTIKDAPMPDRSHASDRLALLNQASRRWWANASEGDPSTHPKNSDVAAWLTDRGMTESLAKHAATIIRPEWAHSGRKPDA